LSAKSRRNRVGKSKKPIPAARPTFGGAFLADRIARRPDGKLAAEGIIAQFLIWGLPAPRTWHVAVTVFDLPKGKTSLCVHLKRHRARASNHLTSVDVSTKTSNTFTTLHMPIAYDFTAAGRWDLTISLPEYRRDCRVSFRVGMQPWPNITRSELHYLVDNPMGMSHGYVPRLTDEAIRPPSSRCSRR
jgi:hypothetical protein